MREQRWAPQRPPSGRQRLQLRRSPPASRRGPPLRPTRPLQPTLQLRPQPPQHTAQRPMLCPQRLQGQGHLRQGTMGSQAISTPVMATQDTVSQRTPPTAMRNTEALLLVSSSMCCLFERSVQAEQRRGCCQQPLLSIWHLQQQQKGSCLQDIRLHACKYQSVMLAPLGHACISWSQPGSPSQPQLRPELRRRNVFTFDPARTQLYAC